MRSYDLCIILLIIGLSTKSTLEKENDGIATIIIGGDVSFSGPVKYFASDRHGCDYKKPFDKVKEYFRGADLSIVNLESSISKDDPSNRAFSAGKAITLAAEKKSLQGLRYAGIDAIMLANNHLFDFGMRGVNTTVNALYELEFGVIGIGYKEDQLNSQIPLVKNIKGNKVGFLGYCLVQDGCQNVKAFAKAGPAIFSLNSARADINALSKKVDCIIVIMHWGNEYYSYPSLFLRKLAQTIIELGAQAIVGSHTHVVMPNEKVNIVTNQKLVAYGLGNLLFPTHISDPNKFRPWGKASKEDEEFFKKAAMNEWDPTRYGTLLQMKLKRGKLKDAWIMPITIKLNTTNNCLQPTPSTLGWIQVCGFEDLYQCPNLSSFFSGANFDHLDA